MEIGTGWLDYGMAGLLALVLVGVGLFIRELVAKSHEKDAATQEFMRSMITEAAAERKAHLDAWQATTEKVITAQAQSTLAQEKTVDALRGVGDTIKAQGQESLARHDVVIQQLRELREHAGGGISK